MNKHCKGCLAHHNAGHPPNHKYARYNDWCCAKGDFASKSIGHCKVMGLKRIDVKQC